MSFDLAKVVAVHPGGYAIDVVMYTDGARFSNVQVVSGQASNNSGCADLRQPKLAHADEPWSFDDSGDGDQIAVIGLIGGLPICFGFLFPQVAQMLFSDINRAIRRHASDWYETVDALGNYEMYHPSGTYLRIGDSPGHEDLTGKDFDGKWQITKNTSSAPYVHLRISNAGQEVASVDFDPQGNVTLVNNGNLDTTTKGAASISVTKDVTATVGGNLDGTVSGNTTLNVSGNLDATAAAINLTGPTTIDGNVLINGATTLNGGLSQGAGSAGGSCSINGPMNVATDVNVSGDVVIQGKSTINHDHVGDSGGTTGPMQN